MNRRQFIKKLSNTSVGLALYSSLPWTAAHAYTSETQKSDLKNLIIVRANGGIHPPLGLNPFILDNLSNRKFDSFNMEDPNEFYATYTDDQLVKTRNGLVLGPGAAPLLNVADDFVIVSGVLMLPESIGHETNRRYASTGSINVNSKYLTTVIGQKIGFTGFGAIQNVSGDASVNDTLTGITFDDFNNLLSGSSNSVRQKQVVDSIVRARNTTNQMESASQSLELLSNELEKLNQSDRYAQLIRSNFMVNNELDRNLQTALLGIMTNTSPMAVVDINFSLNGFNFDTHFNHSFQQSNAQNAIFNSIARLISLLKSLPHSEDENQNLYDETVLLFTSDFSRTSWRQDQDGTDHNPFNNSFLIAGGPYSGGKRVGQSHIFSKRATRSNVSSLSGLPYDFNNNTNIDAESLTRKLTDNSIKSGECSETHGCIDFIKPSDVLWTISNSFGLIERPAQFTNAKIINALRRS